MKNNIIIIAVSFILLAIILGAFGAHSLEKSISAERIQSFETGVRYQMYHGLALLILGFHADRIPFSIKSVYWLLVVGTLLFSCSIYLLAIQELLGFSVKFLGPVTPVGGSLMIIAWFVFLVNLFRAKT